MGFERARAVLALTAVLAVLASALPATSSARAEPAVRIDASSGASTEDASTLLHPAADRRALWRSRGQSVGARLILRLDRTTPIDSVSIRGAKDSRIRDARLEFSDGSSILIRADVRGDRRVVFPSRAVRWVRLVVVATPVKQASVALAGLTVSRSPAARATARRTSEVAPVRIRTSGGAAVGTRWTASRAGAGQWIQADFAAQTEISAVRIEGSASTPATTTSAGYLRFSDGSRVIVGALEPLGGAPTTVAFTPRVATSVRFVATSVRGAGHVAVHALTIYPVGVVPASAGITGDTYRGSLGASSRCIGGGARSASARLELLCPSNGAAVRGTLHIVVAGPRDARLSAEAWSKDNGIGAIRVVGSTRFDKGGTAKLAIRLGRLMQGPTALRLSASGVSAPLYVQIVNRSGIRQVPSTTALTRGMDLKFDERFDGRLSATRTGAGATYASGKPNSYGVDDFGEAIFSTPDGSRDSMATVPGGYLRVTARALSSTEKDPAPYGRRSRGGLLSSAHMGGSGFAAQYGYFEARVLAPAGRGTWPAFWMLSTGSLAAGGSTGEIDAVELYGQDPSIVYQTSHSWVDHKDVLGRSVASRLPSGGDWALTWHTYGALVRPDRVSYTVDGVVVGSTPATVHSDEPFFFLMNLALKQGWRAGLAGTSDRVDLFVDSIRVWV